MARPEGLVGEPEILSGGPRERFSSPRWFVFRVVALGLIAVALAVFAGYRLGTTHERSRQGLTPGDVGDAIAVPVGRPSGEGFGAGSIWVPLWSTDAITSHANGSVARYDPATRRMLAMIQVGSQPLAAQPGFGSIWVTNAGDGTVTRIDPSLNVVLKTIRVGPGPYQIAPAGGGMWVATQSAAVKIDPTTDRVVRRTPYPHPPNSEPPSTAGVALDANSHGVWVSTAFGTVLRLRPSDGRVLAKIRVQPVPRSSPGMVAIDGNNVWVSNYAIEGGIGPTGGGEVYGPSDHLVDISSLTNKIVARVPTAGYPVESFLPHNNTLLMVGVDYMNGKSVLIRTDWPYQTLTYVRALDASSFGVVDIHGFLWIPSFKDRTLQILPDSNGLSNSPYQGG
jgi:YVTN family beta-propeller protein